jgi:predicted ribosome quality control (RQC) complex YloA/Tae2 family protein
MAEESAKGAFIEKLVFALLPLLVAGVGYLLSAVSSLSRDVTVLTTKTSLVVTADNKQASNTTSELAREKLKEELVKEIQKNRDEIGENRQRIAVLEERINNFSKGK